MSPPGTKSDWDPISKSSVTDVEEWVLANEGHNEALGHEGHAVHCSGTVSFGGPAKINQHTMSLAYGWIYEIRNISMTTFQFGGRINNKQLI